MEAGASGVTGPSRHRFTASAFRASGTTQTISRASRICWIEIEMARSMTYRAAAAAARDPLGALHLSSMAKVGATETAGRVADRCVQVMGGTGVSGDTVVEQVFREVRAFRIYDGASEVHRASVAGRVLRRVAARRPVVSDE
jgi:acyl-CoA dehydrogenase